MKLTMEKIVNLAKYIVVSGSSEIYGGLANT